VETVDRERVEHLEGGRLSDLHLVFVEEVPCGTQLVISNSDGSHHRALLAPGPGDSQPDWGRAPSS